MPEQPEELEPQPPEPGHTAEAEIIQLRPHAAAEIEHHASPNNVNPQLEEELHATFSDNLHMFTGLLKRRFGLQDADVEEVLQNSYIRAWRNVGKFKATAKMRTWVYRIVHNEATTFATRLQRRQHNSIENVQKVIPGLEPTVHEEAVASDLWHRFTQGLEHLPDRLRDAMELRAKYDMSDEEIANRLGISRGNVRIRMHRARNVLRALILDKNKEGEE